MSNGHWREKSIARYQLMLDALGPVQKQAQERLRDCYADVEMEGEIEEQSIKCGLFRGLYEELRKRIKTVEGLDNATEIAIVDLISTLNSDVRQRIFRQFCIHCGSQFLPCYCIQDD